jgi:hypothetical protein
MFILYCTVIANDDGTVEIFDLTFMDAIERCVPRWRGST